MSRNREKERERMGGSGSFKDPVDFSGGAGGFKSSGI